MLNIGGIWDETQSRNKGEELEWTFRAGMKIAKRYIKNVENPIPFITMEMQIKTRGAVTSPMWMATIKKTRDNKFQAVEEKEYWWGLVQM